MHTGRTRRRALAMSSGLGVAVLAACTGASSTTSPLTSVPAPSVEPSATPTTSAATPAATVPARPPAPLAPPDVYLEVLGRCTTAGGTLRARSHGFTPGGTVTASATLNDGVTDYPRLTGTFPVATNGSVQWRWSCAGTPPGRYIIQFTDSGVGVSFTTTFRVAAG